MLWLGAGAHRKRKFRPCEYVLRPPAYLSLSDCSKVIKDIIEVLLDRRFFLRYTLTLLSHAYPHPHFLDRADICITRVANEQLGYGE